MFKISTKIVKFAVNMNDNLYMLRAIELAHLGAGRTSPNPMVGAVIVFNNSIIGEGWHQIYGGPHAEVNAINSVADKSLLQNATIYVTLEPCSHWGKTPPCADLIIKHQIPRVVIGSTDPFPKVNGGGIQKLQQAGIDVKIGVLEAECRQLNAPFFTSNTLHRPYIILKWAQTADGFIDIKRPIGTAAKWFTGNTARTAVHKMRAHSDAIMVGRHTVELDNPSLTVRSYYGPNPIRITLDSKLQLSTDLNIFNNDAPTLLFTSPENISSKKFADNPSVELLALDYSQPTPPQIVKILHERNIQSLIIEGGTQLLQSFINSRLFDQIDIYTSTQTLAQIHQTPAIEGVKAPEIKNISPKSENSDDTLNLRTLYF